MKDTTTGKSTWPSIGATSPPINIEDVSVTTQAEKQIIVEGVEPQIIPFGVKGEGGRVASLVGTFKGKSIDGPQMDSYFQVLQEDPKLLGYGLTLTGTNAGKLLPELGIPGTSKWRIEQFSWDRNARQLGQWKFNITLSYIWDPTVNEIKLYDDGIGTNTPENVKFRVTTGIAQSNFTNGTDVFSPKIEVMVDDLNRATFKTNVEEFEKGEIIHIYCETQKSKAVFFGIIVEITKDSSGVVKYDCTEIGTLLQRIPCAKITAGLFKPKIKIPNPYKVENGVPIYFKLKQLVGIIMKTYEDNAILNYHPGYGIDKSDSWGAKDVIPGTTNKIPAQLLSSMNVLAALDNLVIKQCGMRTWFDNDTGKMEYGFIRNKVTIDPTKEYIMNTSKSVSQTEEFNADYILLHDDQGKHVASLDGDLRGKTYIAYQINTKHGDLQLKQIAQRIQRDVQLDNDSFKVMFPAGTVRFQDGDVFNGLGDSTVSPKMTWRNGSEANVLEDPSDSSWQIKHMVITDTYTECLVGASYYSVFDIYKTSLKRISEAPVKTESKDVETSERVIYTTNN